MTKQDFGFSYLNQQVHSYKSSQAPSAPADGPAPYNFKDIQMTVGKMDVFNYSLHQNGIPPIRGIQIINNTGVPAEGLVLRITSDFPFFHPFEKKLSAIPSGKGKPVILDDPALAIDGKILAELTETVKASVIVELLQNEKNICTCRGEMLVLAYDQWQGDESYRNLLPAFVMPNHPAIPALMHDAAMRLKKWGKSSSLEGYQSNDPNRVRDLAAAAYAAIQKKNIVYAEPPASFSTIGQRIRTPEIILEQRLGTCMDMTLLYAALLEGIGLHPILVMIKGHIFAGVWLKERTPEELKSDNLVIDHLNQLKKRIDNGSDEMTFVECTSMCSGKETDFETAEKIAKGSNLNDPDTFRFAIDVYLARVYGIRPIPSRIRDGSGYTINAEEIRESEITEAPKKIDISVSYRPAPGSAVRKITDKKELWESKLLDLSQHNMLLNLPLNASVMPIMSSHIDELEDALADGHEFHLYPVDKEILEIVCIQRDKKGKEEKPVMWLQQALQEQGVFEITEWPSGEDFDFNEKFRQEYRSHRLYTFFGEKQLDRELTNLYRRARASRQENGVSSLYLAIGLLRWFADSTSNVPSYAPLILLPVEIIRKSANQGYALHARDEESHFNTTLLEMLSQNYNLQIPGLDPLPVDEHGIDIKKAFSIVRSAVFSLSRWNVVETCVIGNFSFAQFAMWNDLRTAGNALEQNKVVRSLMRGHVDWDISSDLKEEDIYLPITVDGTQLQAIRMAAKGTTFVLHGPPGTGKSQTITAMIANLMAQGKKVLFVAEKMAALSVVQKRLSSLGIGDFCLELHSDKANKKQVLSQLEKALAIRHSSRRTEYIENLKKAEAGRAKLDGYAQHLHAAHNSGYSLHDLIDLYETVRDAKSYIPFNSEEAVSLSREDVRRHLPLLSRLTVAGEAVGNLKENPLREVGLTSYSAEVRSAVRGAAEMYINALNNIQQSSTIAASILGMEYPAERQDYVQMDYIVSCFEGMVQEPALLDLLQHHAGNVRAYLEKDASLQKWREVLLGIWQKEFLDLDVDSILARHEQAAKKFFGKASAMSAITAEVQRYARKSVTFEMIPALFQPVRDFRKEMADHKAALERMSADARKVLAEYPSLPVLDTACVAAENYIRQADSFPGGLQAVRTLVSNPDTHVSLERFHNDWQRLIETENRFNSLLSRNRQNTYDNNPFVGRNSDGNAANNHYPQNSQQTQNNQCAQNSPQTQDSQINWAVSEQRFCEYLIRHRSALKDWGLYNQIRQECVKTGLEPAVEAYENGLPVEEVIPAYKKGFYYALITGIMYGDDVLSSFSGVTFNESIRQFKRLDDMLLAQTKEEIFYLLASRVPTSWDSPEVGRELNLLRKAIGSNARGMSIRALFDRIPHVYQALCPCMLMSPNSVAQYLAQKNDLFDVVIFDEASQLPTCKAVGALFRAKDAVIVGDPRQMPPTSFFAGSGPEVDDLALADLDSILDDALALGIPSQHLQWHYRSTHESLIAFSNSHFYRNRMFTFPSANDRERHVTAVHVDGTYKNNINVKEAEAVVAEIVQRFHDPKRKDQSIGVVTFNIKQQALIENLLAKQFQTDSALDAWANGGEDSLFVKNLENVQGDERDVILFSIGYGPDEKGKISMNFGPINKSGGGKRLNVAFSRSRVSMTIFTSLYSSDIKVTENSPEGLIAFRDFLHFAEGNELYSEEMKKSKDRLDRAGILNSICRIITENGFQCQTMVGHSDFHVDLAVVDPYEPTKYLMGILLDGEGYHKTVNTRDREIAQISVLRNLGWTLHRIWTIDWWDDREREIRRLLKKLDALKTEAEKQKNAAKAKEEAIRSGAESIEKDLSGLQTQLEAQAAEVVAEDEDQLESKAVEVATEDKDQLESQAVEVAAKDKDQPEAKAVEVASEDEDQLETQAVEVAAEDKEKAPEEETSRTKPEGDSMSDESSEEDKSSEEDNKERDAILSVFRKLYEADVDIIDKRKNGGALWVKGGKNLSPMMDEFRALGINFFFKKGGGRATRGEDAWYSQNKTLQVPTEEQLKAVLKEASDDYDYSANTSVGNHVSRFDSDKTEPDTKSGEVTKTGSGLTDGNVEENESESQSDSPVKAVDNIEKSHRSDNRDYKDPFDYSRNVSVGDFVSRFESKDYVLSDYTAASLPADKMSSAEFASSKNSKVIRERILQVLQAEAPIQKELLIRRILKSFGVSRTKNVSEAIEKALKAAKAKSTKQGGLVYCWLRDQDPNQYRTIRGGSTSKDSRNVTEICQQEMKNAICYVLQEKGSMDKESIVKETFRVLGYHRMTDAVASAIETGLKYAKRTGAIQTGSDKKLSLYG